MDEKMKKDVELLQKIIESEKTDEFLEKIHKEERNLNEKKYEAFKNILACFKKSFEGEDVKVSFGLLDQFNPRSGWISVSGKYLQLMNLNEIGDAIKEVSNLSIEVIDEDVVEVSVMIYDIVELV